MSRNRISEQTKAEVKKMDANCQQEYAHKRLQNTKTTWEEG